MNSLELKDAIQSEIDRLSSNHEEANINLINNVLRPMLLFIDDHNKVMSEIARISGKHTLWKGNQIILFFILNTLVQ